MTVRESSVFSSLHRWLGSWGCLPSDFYDNSTMKLEHGQLRQNSRLGPTGARRTTQASVAWTRPPSMVEAPSSSICTFSNDVNTWVTSNDLINHYLTYHLTCNQWRVLINVCFMSHQRAVLSLPVGSGSAPKVKQKCLWLLGHRSDWNDEINSTLW